METESFENQWIANLDLLGMTAAMRSANHRAATLRSYLAFVRTRRHGLKPLRGDFGSEVEVFSKFYAELMADQFFLFSDSIFFSQEADPELTTCDYFSLAVVQPVYGLLSYAWKSGLFLRGALSYGEAHVATDLSIIIGPAVVNSVQWQEVQEWPWVSLDPTSAQLAFPMLDTAQDILVPYDVPTKNGPVTTYALSPSWLTPNDADHFISQWRRAREAGIESNIRKWVNLIKFCLEFGFDFPQMTREELAMFS